jgi:hypothetical protein
MGIVSKIVGAKTPHQDPNELTIQELEFILTCMKSVTIAGEQVESFYNMVIKLQNQYTQQLAKQEK